MEPDTHPAADHDFEAFWNEGATSLLRSHVPMELARSIYRNGWYDGGIFTAGDITTKVTGRPHTRLRVDDGRPGLPAPWGTGE